MEHLHQPGVGRAFAPAAAWWLAAAAAGVAWAALMPGLWLIFAAAGAGSVGAVKLLRALAVLSRERHAADDWLRSATGSFVPPRYAWRASQLRAACERRRLAKTLRRIERRSAERTPGGYGAVRLRAVCEHRDSVRLLASRLERIDQPVTPAGMLLVAELIANGQGPLWNEPRGAALPETISTALDVLTPKPSDWRERPRAA